jgi:hypothetical protein
VSTPTRIGDDTTIFVMRLLQECLDDATPMSWERRALDFERYPCPRNLEIAQACRNKAAFLRMYPPVRGEIGPEVRAVVEDVIGDGS